MRIRILAAWIVAGVERPDGTGPLGPAEGRRASVRLALAAAILAIAAGVAGVRGAQAAAEDALPRSAQAPLPDEELVLPDAVRDVDLTGRWLLEHTVLSSERDAYEGLELQFRVDLVQKGRRVTGTALKLRENGKAVAPAARSRLQFEGTVVGREIVGRYVEVLGSRRTRGSFRWRYSLEEGSLRGTFRSSVANSAGASRAVAIG